MSDQPKPATSAYKGAEIIINPATGEWTTTADKDGDCAIVTGTTLIGVGATVQQTLNIIDAHNAALAAAWRKGHADAQAPALERIDELHQQLAAEREKIEVLNEMVARLAGK